MTMKKIIFTLVSVTTSIFAYAQATLSAGPDQTICAPNSATLTATIVPQAPIAYAPDSYNGGTLVPFVYSNTDDRHSSVIPIGFSFCFLGNTYTNLVVSSNNYVTFDLTVADTYSPFTTMAVPDVSAPLNSIMGPWQDIYPSASSNIRYAVYGVAPNRHMTISWDQIPMYSCTSLIYSSQLQLYETSGVIESHIANRPLCSTWNNGNAVHALHNANGTFADIVPGRNNTPWTISNEGYRWTPQGNNPVINWYANGILVGTGITINVSPIVDTEYICQIDNTSASTCASGVVSDTVKVFVSSPAITTTFQNADCITGLDGSMSASVTGAATPYNFSWNTVPVTNTAAVTGVTPGIYTVTLTDANGCIAQEIVTITDQGNLISNIVATIDLACHGVPTGNLEVVGLNSTAPYMYILGNDTSYNGIFSNLYAGTHDVIVKDAVGCTLIQPVVINEPAFPLSIAQTAHTNVSCFGGNDGAATFTANGGTAPYDYSSGVSNNTTGIFSNLVANPYLFSVSDANGCYVTFADTITQPQELIVSIPSFSNIVCFGQANGSATADVLGGVGPYFYTWNTTPVQNNQIATNLTAGNYTVTVSDNNGCTATNNIQLVEPVAIVLTADSDLFICQTFDTILVAYGSGGFGAMSYNWMPDNINNDTLVVSPLVTTIYTVTVTDSLGCTVSEPVEVTVFGNPEPNVVSNNYNGCQSFCPTFTDLPYILLEAKLLQESGVLAMDKLLKNDSVLDHCYINEGKYNLTLTVVSDKGCTSTATWEDFIEVYPNPKADFIANPPSTNILSPAITFTNHSSGAEHFLWNFGDNDSIFTESNIHHSYRDTGSFSVRMVASTDKNCIDSIKSTVVISPYYTFYIPTSFTPNGDGLNDLFEIQGNYIQACDLVIFDRWGKNFLL
jgi:hypothetical protein